MSKQATEVLNKYINSPNIAKFLDREKLINIGKTVVEGYEADEKSRISWKKNLEEWTKTALQITSPKTFPWPNASNIKFPLLSTAALQFAARAYPTLVPADGKLVKCRVVGSDLDGEKTKRAIRISKHMSYQLLEEMTEWEEQMDKLLVILPIAGTVFKKTYFDNIKARNVSSLVMPKDLVVNYWTKSIEDSERITEIHEFSKRKVEEKVRAGLYLDTNIGKPTVDNTQISLSDPGEMTTPETDSTTPFVFLEQHCYLDLDEDNYAEPYIVLVEKESKEVLRIVARYDTDSVQVSDTGEVVSITPVNYYTKFSFFPNPDGGFYDIGFGRLLGPINASVDTIINQLTDAGTLSNLQSGFIGKGLRIKMGDSAFKPGEWKAVNATGSDIKSQVFPLPVREPSEVLFKLLSLLSQSAKELASVAEIFVGKMPGQNTPATTTMASIEQGMKLFTAVYKRVYRSLAKEFQKLYKLNKLYLDPQLEIDVLDEPIQQSDYLGNENDIIPAADPSAASSQERVQKAQNLMQLIGLGTINPMEVTQRMLEALEEPSPEKLIMQPQPQPDPKAQSLQMKAQLDQQTAEHDMALKEKELELKKAGDNHKADLQKALADQKLQSMSDEAALKMRIAALEAGTNHQAKIQELQQNAATHLQNTLQKTDEHQQKLVQQKQILRAKPQPKK